MKLNEKILYYRKAAKLSQEELAVRVGVSRQAVSKWELADATPEVDKLLALARAFGVTTDELLSESEPAQFRKGEDSPSEKTSPRTGRSAAAEDGFDRAAGRVGGFIRKYGWLAGVYVSLYGLGGIVVGALARWGFRTMFSSSLGAAYNGLPELEGEVLGELGLGYAVSPFGGFALRFANVILLIGGVIAVVGAVLAVVLYRMGHKKNDGNPQK